MSLNLNGLGGLDLIRAVPRNLSREQARDLIRQGLDAIPAIADRIQRAGYVRLPNGQWGLPEERDRAMGEVRRRVREVEARRANGGDDDEPYEFDFQDSLIRLGDSIARNINAGELIRAARQISNYQPNRFVQFGLGGLNYALGDFSERNPILGLLFNSIASGAAAGLSTSNPLVGFGVAAKDIVSGAYNAWQKHRENAAREERERRAPVFYDEESGEIPDIDFNNREIVNERDVREREREIAGGAIRWNDREIIGNPRENPRGEPADRNESRSELERERREAERRIDAAKALQDPVRFFNNLRIERVANFSITPQSRTRITASAKRLRPFDFLQNYSPFSSVFSVVR